LTGCRARQRRRRHEITSYERGLLKRLQPSRCEGTSTTTTNCQYRPFIHAGRRPTACYYCSHCRDGCCPASWLSASGGSPLLASGPDQASTVDDGGLLARTPALYCSCGVVGAPNNQPDDTDIDRKSDDDDVTPASDVGDELGGLVMQRAIQLMLPSDRRRRRLWYKQQHQAKTINHRLIDDTLLRPAAANNTLS